MSFYDDYFDGIVTGIEHLIADLEDKKDRTAPEEELLRALKACTKEYKEAKSKRVNRR